LGLMLSFFRYPLPRRAFLRFGVWEV